MSMLRLFAAGLLFIAAGCAAHHADPVENMRNPLLEKAERLNAAGVGALQQHRFARAAALFRQAAHAATLADNAHWLSLSWYNAGRALEADGDISAARNAYRQAMRLSGDDAVNRMRARLALSADGDAPLIVPDAFPADVHLAAGERALRHGRDEAAQHAFVRVLKKAGKGRRGLIYAARAHLGLAELRLKSDEKGAADRHVHQALDLLHRAGAPALTAHALRLAARLAGSAGERQRLNARARRIMRAMQAANPE